MLIEERGSLSLTMYTVIWQGSITMMVMTTMMATMMTMMMMMMKTIGDTIRMTFIRLRGFYGTLGIDIEDGEIVLSEARSRQQI